MWSSFGYDVKQPFFRGGGGRRDNTSPYCLLQGHIASYGNTVSRQESIWPGNIAKSMTSERNSVIDLSLWFSSINLYV